MLKRESRGKYWIEILKNNFLFQKAVSQNNSIKKKEIHQKINVCNFKKIQQKDRKQTKSAKIGYTVKLFSKHCGTQNWGLGLRTGSSCGSLLTPTAFRTKPEVNLGGQGANHDPVGTIYTCFLSSLAPKLIICYGKSIIITMMWRSILRFKKSTKKTLIKEPLVLNFIWKDTQWVYKLKKCFIQ